jgi:hypothetical protein
LTPFIAASSLAEPSITGIITAVAASFTALGGLLVSVRVLIPSLKTAKDTHKIVNQQRTDMQNYNRALMRALKDHGIDLPVDQSIPTDVADGTETAP